MKKSFRGKAIVGQSGGCTAVINQSMAGVVDAARGAKAISQIWGMRYGVTGLLKGDLIDLKIQPPSLLRGIRETPSSALGSSRHKLNEGEEFQVFENLRKWGVRFLFMIGGNDTAETVLRIAKAAETKQYDLKVIHIPKTIDNDLVETDHCPGYGSIGRFVAVTTQEASLDTRAMRYVDPVKIIELMGRNSGWIVAAASLLKRSETDAPHILQVPEVSFREEVFLKQVDQTLTRVGCCVVVIAETIRDPQGNKIGALKEGITQDPFGHRYVEGAAKHLARLVEKNFKVRARYDKPGTLARMSIPYVSDVDQKEAYDAGRVAVKWALKGISKAMVSFLRVPGKRCRIRYRPVDLEKIPHRERYLPREFLNEEKTGTTEAFREYALPLIGKKIPEFPCLKTIVPKI